MSEQLANVVDIETFPLYDEGFRTQCKNTLDTHGALVLRNFIKPETIAAIQAEGKAQQQLAFYTASDHNIYLTPPDDSFAPEHPRNRLISSSKGCITDDQIPTDSSLHTLYDANGFRDFLCSVLGIPALYEYADPLSSINLHYASEGQELGWHFDNSSFAITLMIQSPVAGGKFEYVKDVRDADAGEMNFERAALVLDGEITPDVLEMEPGALVLFRGRNSIHRVTPTEGDTTRMLVVLAYNTEPDVSLSESARMTFYGRLS
ncbi:2OG-Fe(II) oxygenase [Leucothrix sargassi]|nr:2OG-Fe(II) oxygenase [Leucothrix sargassi]